MLLCEGLDVRNQERNVVRVARSTCVPIVWNPLCTRGILQATLIYIGHGVKGFQGSQIQKSLWVSSGFVAKHVEDERVGPRRNEEARETSEVVWILGDRLIIWKLY